MPCVGIDGAGAALDQLGVKWLPNNIYDLEGRYRDHLSSLMVGCPLHLGPTEGDVTRVKLQSLERPVDMVISGPPCPPWAGNGCRRGESDIRSQVFVAVLRIVIALAKAGDLSAVCLENVKGIVQKSAGQTQSFMDKVLAIMQDVAPEFSWDVAQLNASDFNLAQQRARVFLRGVRTTYFPQGVPPALEPFGSRPLTDFLSPDLPYTKRSSLTKVMAQNLKDAEKKLQEMLRDDELKCSDVVMFPLDRADGKVYKRRYYKNICPTLTTNNAYLFICSLDFDRVDSERIFSVSSTQVSAWCCRVLTRTPLRIARTH